MSPRWGLEVGPLSPGYRHVAPLGLNESITFYTSRFIPDANICQPLHNLHRLQTDRDHLSD